MRTFTLDEVIERFDEILDLIELEKRPVMIQQDGKERAVFVPIEEFKKFRLISER